MTVESASYLESLNSAYPASGDQQAEGDDHLRLLKSVLKGTFPGRGGVDSRVISKATGYTPAATEVSALYQHTAGLTVTLPAVAGVVAGAYYIFYAQSGTTTLTPNGADTINGGASATLAQGVAGILFPVSGGWVLLYWNGAVAGANNTLSNLLSAATARSNLGVENAEIDVASAATTNIGAAAGQNIRITGTATITAFDSAAAGVTRRGRFAGALTLTHNATTLILPNGQSIVTAAGDTFEFLSLGSGNWVLTNYQKVGAFAGRTLTISTSAPSGGADGDIWFEREA